MKSASVSVIIPHYNDNKYLNDSLCSIMSQSFRDMCVVFVDDCSNNNDWKEIIAPYTDDSRLFVYETSKNVGPYRIKNKVLSMVDSPYIAFHDSDDQSFENRINHQYQLLKNSKIDLVGTSFYEVNEDQSRSLVTMPKYPKLMYKFGKSFVLLHPTCMMKYSVLNTLKGFDGTTKIAADDEFFMRAMFSCKIRNIRKPLYTKRNHPHSLTESQTTGFGSKIRKIYNQQTASRYKQIRKNGKHYFSDSGVNNIEFKLNLIN